jgi:hypothetical protein
MIIIKMTHKVAKSLTVHIFLYTLTSDLLLLVLSVYYYIANIELDTEKLLILSIVVIVIPLTNYSDPASSFFVTNTSTQNMLHTEIMKKLLFRNPLICIFLF